MNFFRNQRLLTRLFHAIAILWLGILFYYAIRLTGLNLNSANETITICYDFFIKNIFKFVFGLLCVYLIGKMYDIFLYKLPQWIFPTVICV
ncbi:MAG: hypothetical protein K6G30_04665, partial [Acetatifactor sp.]|nr:hypothetical protein [Acetatifactor sp.]